MLSVITDLRHAARTLARVPAFTAVCVTSLGLGMGVVMGILVFLRAVLGTPPGVVESGLAELVVRPSGQLLAQAGGPIIDTWSYPDYLDVRDATPQMTVSGWSRGEGLFQPADGPAMPVSTMYASSHYFSTIGVTLARGRGFTPVDDASHAETEAVISHRAWQVRFGGDPDIVGRTITVNRTQYTVVGVAPEGFRGHVAGLNEPYYQLWLPLSHHPRLTSADDARLQRDANWVRLVARLAPGTTVAQADAIVQSAMATLAARYPATNQDKAGGVEPYDAPGARMRAQITTGRMIVLGLAAIVLLVVGLNISGMMVARSAVRERDLAIRSAIGASRWRLMRQHFAEALVVALLGGALASLVVFGGPLAIAAVFDLWGPAMELFRPDPWIALQCVGLCLVTSLVLGLLPAVRFSRTSVVTTLKNDSSGSGRRVGRLQRFTAAAQAGLAVPFLVICGVQFDQARVALITDVGFVPQGLYAAEVNLAAIATSEEERRLFVEAAQRSLAQAPGVTSASVADGLPLDFVYRNARVSREGEGTFVTAHTTRVRPGYLDTIGTRLLAGRMIDAGDRAETDRVVVLSDPLANQLFPAGDAVGQRIALALSGDETQTFTVVGVTADLVSTQMGNPRPQLFLSLAQEPTSSVFLVARGASSDAAIRVAFERAVEDALRVTSTAHEVDAASLGAGVRVTLVTGDELIENSRQDLLTSSGVGGAAAAVALMLAALGVYGVIAFMVATRTREIGLRVALGATRARVVGSVLGDALRLVVPGVALGLLLAVAWVRLTDPAWYPLGGVEPLVYTIAAATAFLVAVIAGLPSARRAAAIQPMVAMRAD